MSQPPDPQPLPPPQQPPPGWVPPQYQPQPGQPYPPQPGPPYPPPPGPGYYPPPQYGSQPGQSAYQHGYPPPPQMPGGAPPRKRRTGRWVLLYLAIAFVVVIIIGQLTGGGDNQNQPAAGGSTGDSGTAAQPAPAGQGAVGLGSVARDGDFAFRVKGIDCGRAAANAVYNAPDFTGTLPPGSKECIVELRVTDDKGEAQTFFDSNQTAIDARGHQLTADDNGIYLTGDKDDTQLNPGVSITALVPYNLPRGDRITALELHDSEFSGGVRVQL